MSAAVHPVALLILGVAAYRIARVPTRDSISIPWRQRLFAWAWAPRTDPSTGLEQPPEPRGFWRPYVHEGLTCPLCLGVWVSLGVYLLWLGWAGASWSWHRSPVEIAAVAGLQCFLQSREGG